MKRAQARAKCGCGKTLFSTWDKAMKAVVRAGADRPYWCAEGGGYHITRYSKEENARRHQEQVVMSALINLPRPAPSASVEAGTRSRRAS